jgi:hypothetical protein
MNTRRRRNATAQLELFEPTDLFAPPRQATYSDPMPEVRSTPLEQELFARALDRLAREEIDPQETARLELSAMRLRGRKLH